MGDFNSERNFEPDLGKRLKLYLTGRNVAVDYLYVAVFCVFIAVFLKLIAYGGTLIQNLIYSEAYGLSIYSSILVLYRLFKPERSGPWVLLSAVGVLIGTLIGWQAGTLVTQGRFAADISRWPGVIMHALTISAVVSVALIYFFYAKSRIRIGDKQIQEERIKRLSSEKETLEAGLKMLQAQIEPHFLFNTLSNVISLIDTEPAKGKAMLMDLTQLLRTSLYRTRSDRTTLDQEITLLRSYLNIQRTRMGERLRFSIEAPEALGSFAFPPMLIQPLVENAVKHGIEPKIEGGEISIKASDQDGRIRIEVADTGCGFAADKNEGLGIANIRERLKLLYDGRANFILVENQPQGVKVTIEVPKDA